MPCCIFKGEQSWKLVGSICSWWWTVFAGDSGQYLLWCKLCNNALFEFCTSFSVLSLTLGENFFGNRSLFASTEWQDQIFSQIELYLQTKACRVKPAEGLILRKTICAHNNFRRSSYLMSKVFFRGKFLEVECHKHWTLIVSSTLFLFFLEQLQVFHIYTLGSCINYVTTPI